MERMLRCFTEINVTCVNIAEFAEEKENFSRA